VCGTSLKFKLKREAKIIDSVLSSERERERERERKGWREREGDRQ